VRDAQPPSRELGGVAGEVATGLRVDDAVAREPHDPAVVRVPVALLELDVDHRLLHGVTVGG
jgi:hypothetical protein